MVDTVQKRNICTIYMIKHWSMIMKSKSWIYILRHKLVHKFTEKCFTTTIFAVINSLIISDLMIHYSAVLYQILCCIFQSISRSHMTQQFLWFLQTNSENTHNSMLKATVCKHDLLDIFPSVINSYLIGHDEIQ
jgi:hypothetical protein